MSNLSMYEIPVVSNSGQNLVVTVLATDRDAATVIAERNHVACPEVVEVIDFLNSADFQTFWAEGVEDELERASMHDGPLPGYAVKRVKWALSQARYIERKMNRQMEQGGIVLANLPANERDLVRS